MNYKPPKDDEDENDIISNFLKTKGCAPEVIEEKLQLLRESSKTEDQARIKKERDEDKFKKNKHDSVRVKREIRSDEEDDNDQIRDKKSSKKKEKPEDDDDLDVIRARKKMAVIKKEPNREDSDNDRIRESAKYDDDNQKKKSHKEHRKRSRSPKRSDSYRSHHKHKY